MVETSEPAGGWTVDTALQHVLSLIGSNDHRYEQRFIDLQKLSESMHSAHKEAVQTAMSAADRAVVKAEMAAEKRFESVNEFRSTLADQQRNLMPRSEVEVITKGLIEKINALEKQLDSITAERQGIKGGWGYAVGVIGFVLTLITLVVLVGRQLP